MSIKDSLIAKKYAQAFLNLSIEKFDDQDILKIRIAYDFLTNNNQVFYSLSLPNIALSVKTKFIDVFLKKFDLNFELKGLFLLLLKDNRINLVKEVLKSIVNIYQLKKNIMIFDISSSYKLDNNDKDIILEFLQKNTDKKILPIYKIDKNLVAGIKLQSGSYLWEYSINKQLAGTNKLLYKLR